MNRSKKNQIIREIYEENLSVSGRRPIKYTGRKIVSSYRRQPPLIILGVVIGIALAYSAVSTSWDGSFGSELNKSAMLNAPVSSDSSQQETNNSGSVRDRSQQLPSQNEHDQQQLAILDASAEEDAAQYALSSVDTEVLEKIRIDDTLDQFFYNKGSVPQSPESLNQSEINAYKSFASAKQSLAKLFGLGVRTIVIDPGHGGKDPGALGHKGSLEKDIALSIGQKLRDRLQRRKDFKVMMTRDSDVHVPLSKRVEFANDNNADLFISIHINSFHSENVNFIETYYFGPNKDAKVLTLAEKENSHSDYLYA
jgi:N-acetylmuramoyl-L-alanine amidase